jgi:hypothetical protein
LPWASRACLNPDAAAAPASSVHWYTGTRSELSGCGPQMIAMHDGGTTATVSGPSVSRMWRAVSGSEHPGHAAWPEHTSESDASAVRIEIVVFIAFT